jgi:hypothetical protein
VMGYAAAKWFEKGERLSASTLSTLTRRITGELLASLRNFGSRKPGRKTLQEAISKSLETNPLNQEDLELSSQSQPG